jgi:hypothetical protein
VEPSSNGWGARVAKLHVPSTVGVLHKFTLMTMWLGNVPTYYMYSRMPSQNMYLGNEMNYVVDIDHDSLIDGWVSKREDDAMRRIS